MKISERLNHFVLGNPQGPKLVFLHGLMGSAANWRKITPPFETQFQVLTLDQRGHGKSFHAGKGYAPEDYAEDLRQLLDELEWDQIHLVGHSMGGRNGLVFADLFSQRVISLVVEDIGPIRNEAASKRIEGMLRIIPTPFESKRAAREFILKEFPSYFRNNPFIESIAQYLYTNIEEQPDGKADWRFDKVGIFASVDAGRKVDRWPEIHRLKVPALWIRGSESDELTREDFARILQANPRIQGVEIEGAGHWVHSDKPDEFISSLQQFFKAQDPVLSSNFDRSQ